MHPRHLQIFFTKLGVCWANSSMSNFLRKYPKTFLSFVLLLFSLRIVAWDFDLSSSAFVHFSSLCSTCVAWRFQQRLILISFYRYLILPSTARFLPYCIYSLLWALTTSFTTSFSFLLWCCFWSAIWFLKLWAISHWDKDFIIYHFLT